MNSGSVFAQESRPEIRVTEAGLPASALAPNNILRFEFPELSENIAKMFRKEGEPVSANVMLADLPSNYSPDKKFPILIYLDGGNGGFYLHTRRLREVTGGQDFICVRLPLFKAAKITTDPAGGLAILAKDYEVISKNYRVMLQKLYDTVPNISSEGSVIGGFSNGAHTTGVLLQAKDPFILEHFSHFYMVEGGIGQFRGEVLNYPELKSKKFLVLLGDGGRPNPFEGRAKGIVDGAKAAGLDMVALPMKGYGHEFPMDYYRLVVAWAKGQPLPDVPPKAAPPANTQAAESPAIAIPTNPNPAPTSQ